jgi:hypothetical protein
VGNKRSTPLAKHLTIRVTEKEYEKAQEYCIDNDILPSEYVRNLIRFHLGMVDDFEKMRYFKPPKKKK